MKRSSASLATSVAAAVVLLGAGGCGRARVTPQRAADIYAVSVQQAAGEAPLVLRLGVAGHGIDDTQREFGTVVLITFDDHTLFGSPERMNAALSAMAAAADRTRAELTQAGIQFVELQAGGGGTRAVVPVSRLLLLAHGGVSADELRASMSLVGNCCPPKGSPSAASPSG